MTHLELENLASEYLEGQLEAARRAQVEAHLGECAACRELVADLRHALDLCRTAEEAEPAPWLMAKILRATVGERKPTFGEKVAAFFRPSPQPRIAYAVAMAIFSFSIIVNAAGINLRDLTLKDLNPRTWIYEARRTGHLLYARAEKFYYDLRVVYEIESRFRRLRAQPSDQPEEAPKPETPPGGSTEGKPMLEPQLASNRVLKNRPCHAERKRSISAATGGKELRSFASLTMTYSKAFFSTLLTRVPFRMLPIC